MKNRFIHLLTTTLMLMAFSTTASAMFIGETLRLQLSFPSISSPISSPIDDAIVGSGVEFQELNTKALPGYIVADVEVDIDENSITWDFINTGGFTTFPSANFNGHVLTDINNSIPSITNVSIDTTATSFLLDTSRIFFNENQVFFNVEGLSIDQGSLVKVNVEFSPVPLPASIWFLVSGVLGLFQIRKKA